MMTSRLTDRAALDRHRLRALALEPRPFLHLAVREELHERLEEVNRTFTAPAVVTGAPGAWSGFAGARLVPDTEVLDLEEGAHDLVIHALGLHWAEDPVGQLIQCRRALRPDGLFIAATLGGQTLNELRRVLSEAESATRGGLSPRVAPMGEIRDLGALLQRAGFALPVADNHVLRATYRSARHLMRDLRALGETNALAMRDRRPPGRAFFEMADRLYAAHFPAGDGRIAATFEIIYLTGWAPSSDQPKPLRPGSATARLADALRSEEQGLGDPAAPDKD